MKLNNYQLAELISKSVQEELSDEECLLLKEWLSESEQNKQLFDRLTNANQVREGLEYFDKLDVDLQWKNAQRAKRLKKISSITPYFKYAVTIVGVAFALFLFLPKKQGVLSLKQEQLVSIENDLLPGGDKAYLTLSNGKVVDLDRGYLSLSEEKGMIIFNSAGELDYSKGNSTGNINAYNTLTIPKKGTYRVVLSDGTKVWLNSLSQLNFPVQFSDERRIVELKGEAYFEVAKDSSRPFIVEVDHNRIEVLGTHFNVNSYDSNWSTTLIEGSVKVTNSRGDKILLPGEEAKVIDGEILTAKANIRKALAWKNNEFYFKDDRLLDVLDQMALWYDFEVKVDKGMADMLISGSIDKDVKLSELLSMLKYITKGTFKVDGRKLTITQ